MKHFGTLFFSTILSIAATGCFAEISAKPDDTVHRYIYALKDQNWVMAESLWLKSDIERSKHLGIKFSGIKAKYDCASPLVYGDANTIDSLCKIEVRDEFLDSLTARINVELTCSAANKSTIAYYATRTDNGWRLCSSLYAYAGNWSIITTKYFSIHYTDRSLVNQNALDALDRFVDSLAYMLRIAPERISALEGLKIDYYLCDENQIKLLTGFDAHGMTSFPFDAIITRHLPHSHEVTHLMVNYALGEAPLFTLPIMQEGLACCLGGRWGKSPEVIDYWGASVVNLGLVDLDSILTQSGFNSCSSGPDAAYAVSSILTRTLIDNYGIDKLMMFYQKLSGNADYVNGMTTNDVIRSAEAIFGDNWQAIRSHFAETAEKYRYFGIIPQNTDQLNEESALILSTNPDVTIWQKDSTYIFRIVLPSDETNGSLFFTNEKVAEKGYVSWQFKEQFPDDDYNGEKYGIRFSGQEAGLYDYLTNFLLAKYVMGFSPSSDYFDAATNAISFSLNKDLLDIDPHALKIVYRSCN